MSVDQPCFGFLEDPVPQSRGTVWVDELQEYRPDMVSARAKSHGTRWCHLWADNAESVEELHRIAKACELKLAYFQDRPGFPHYDLVPSKRAQAIAAGAREKSLREWITERRPTEATSPARTPRVLRRPVDPALQVVPATVVWRRSIKEAACLPNLAHKRITPPQPSVTAPRFEALYPPRSIRADQRTYRLAISRPRAYRFVQKH